MLHHQSALRRTTSCLQVAPPFAVVQMLRHLVRARAFSFSRSFSSARAVDQGESAAWTDQWLSATADVRSTDITFEDSAARLRELVRTGLLRHADLRDDPARFFEAHRILARHAVAHGPGFWIRFTVHYNLCAGTVLAVGSDEQVAAMDEWTESGTLGCFALTEKLAGVQSGLVVNTTATWDESSGTFAVNSPGEGAHKNWISQGFTADQAVVLADLRIGGTSHGPHAFLMPLRDVATGAPLPGVSLGDMGRKTTGNDLDNAWIAFDEVRVPRSALLSKYADVEVEGGGTTGAARYVQKVEGVAPFHMIGQRLFTGRVAVAQAALAYARQLFHVTREYASQKACVSHATLLDVPQLKSVIEEAEVELTELDAFVHELELELSACVAQDTIPSEQLVEGIATAKVLAVERSIDLCFQLKQEVGSFALMADSGFAHMDFLQCCKFAEGDSRILMQKMARDRLKQHARGSTGGVTDDATGESALCAAIQQGMEAELESGASKSAAWDAQWRDVYALAKLVMERVRARYV